MMKLVRKYKELSPEQKIVIKTIISVSFSAILACGKLIVGLFTDYNLISIAVYTFGILFAKGECVLGIESNRLTFRQRSILIALFLMISSAIFIGSMCRMFFIERQIKDNGLSYVLLIAFISFTELGFAITGLVRLKGRGGHYRNIRIINFCVALIAILTTQMNILSRHSATGVVHIANAYSGICIGAFIILCAAYILFVPQKAEKGDKT